MLSVLQPERTGIQTSQIFGFVYSLECTILKNKIKLRAVTLLFFLLVKPPFDINNNGTIQGNAKLKRLLVTDFLVSAHLRQKAAVHQI